MIIASKTLNHSKKTTIVIEKYEPLLKEIAAAKTLEIYDSKIFNFSELRAIKNSYVYHALPTKLKKGIELVLVNVEEYELQGKNLNKKMDSVFNNLLKPECIKYLNDKKDGYVYNFSEVVFINKQVENVKIFELFMSDKLYPQIQSGKIKGYFYAQRFEKGKSYIEEIEEWVEDLLHDGGTQVMLEMLTIYEQPKDDEMYFYTGWEYEQFDYSRYIKENANDIKQEIYFWEEYIKYYEAYNLISNEIVNIENLIQEYIKELLVPHYQLKKLFKKI